MIKRNSFGEYYVEYDPYFCEVYTKQDRFLDLPILKTPLETLDNRPKPTDKNIKQHRIHKYMCRKNKSSIERQLINFLTGN